MHPDAPSTPKPPNAATPNGAPADTTSKAYQPSIVEPAILKKWDAANPFHPDPARVLSGEKRPFCILIPPPNVTGALHLGHALNNTLQDILTRSHRMMGFETLWMPGTDHAGIATQAVVERRLKKEQNKTRKDYTREQFVALVQEWKDEYEKRITGQLKAMGCSCDFARQRFTMDDICARAVREAFFRLFKDGLIYRGKRLVNWDPALQTAVADDECYEEDVDTSFWYLRYPLVHLGTPTLRVGSEERHAERGGTQRQSPQPITWNELSRLGYPGADQHPGEEQAWVTVATTRPETYLGDTAVAINPHDPRAKSLRGLHAELPLVGRIIPIVEDSYVVLPAAMARTEEEKNDPKAAFATGFLKVTPAHDQNDAELGQRHSLAAINMMSPDGRVSDKHGWSDIGDAHIFVGKTMAEVRKLVIREFEARNLLEATKPYRHSIKFSDRSKAVIEPYLSDQWYVKVTDDRLAGAANRALVPDQRQESPERKLGRPHAAAGQHASTSARAEGSPGDGQLRFYPARYAKMYESWHDNIRDWCISRQLWWGHRIPVWKRRLTVTPGQRDYSPVLSLANLSHALFDNPERQISGYVISVESGKRLTGEQCERLCAAELSGEFDVFLCLLDETYIEYYRMRDFEQDPDVLDTWFSSALWPLSTLGWPDPAQSPQTKDLLQAFNPTTVLSTAREIITLWVSRMVMMNRYFLGTDLGTPTLRVGSGSEPQERHAERGGTPGNGPVPFHDVFIHAVVQDGDGKRMSKSAGNGVDPLDIIDSHGADAMRFTLAQMSTNTQDVKLPVRPDPKTGKNTSEKFDAGRNFCNKLWNASRFAILILQRAPSASSGDDNDAMVAHDPKNPSLRSGLSSDLSLVDRWMLSRLAKAVRACESSLKNYEFADYGQTLYQLLWWDVCDWYLEAIKPTVDANPHQRTVLRNALDVVIRLLHPVTPFITETIHEQLRQVPALPIPGIELHTTDLLCTSSWPKIAASLIDEQAEGQFEELRSLITAIRNVRSEHQVLPKRRITLHCSEATAKRIAAAAPGLVESLASLESISTARPTGVSTVAFRSSGEEMHLSNLADAGTVDAGAETDRLTKQLETLRKSESALNTRLSNPGYVDKAPPKLVEESKAQLTKIRAEIAAIEAKLKG